MYPPSCISAQRLEAKVLGPRRSSRAGHLMMAAVEHDKHVSTHSALRAFGCHNPLGGLMSPASLRPAGEAGLPQAGVCVRKPSRLVANSACRERRSSNEVSAQTILLGTSYSTGSTLFGYPSAKGVVWLINSPKPFLSRI